MTQPPEPSMGLCASVSVTSFLPGSATGSCGARWARRQSSGCRADKVPRWYRERERPRTLSSEKAD